MLRKGREKGIRRARRSPSPTPSNPAQAAQALRTLIGRQINRVKRQIERNSHGSSAILGAFGDDEAVLSQYLTAGKKLTDPLTAISQ